jgi:amidohydrolase
MTAATVPRARGADQIQRAVAALAPRLVTLSHDLHAHPETSWREHRSSATVAGFLADAGLRVTRPAHGLPTAFRATAGHHGPLVVICCEYDALPGLGHGCGHNIIAAAAAGAGAVLAPLARSAGGRLVVLGTPAEEGGGGKIELLRRGAFAGASAALLVHPGRHDQVRATFRAAASYRVVFRGRAAHAGMAPEQGRNALDAAMIAYAALGAARATLRTGEQVVAVLTEGGTAPNVIPDRSVLRVMTRSPTTCGLAPLADVVRRAADAGVRATGCAAAIRSDGPTYREVRNDPVLSDLAEHHLRALGRRPRPPSARDLLSAGSTDLGNVSHAVPALHPKLSIGDVPQHSAEFARAAVSPAGDRAVLDGARLLALLTCDIWNTPERST